MLFQIFEILSKRKPILAILNTKTTIISMVHMNEEADRSNNDKNVGSAS
jgi:hypothetical protein